MDISCHGRYWVVCWDNYVEWEKTKEKMGEQQMIDFPPADDLTSCSSKLLVTDR